MILTVPSRRIAASSSVSRSLRRPLKFSPPPKKKKQNKTKQKKKREMRDEFIKLQNVSAYIEVAWITGSSSNSHRIKRLMRGVLRPAPRARDGSRKHPNQRMYGGGGDLGNICVNYFTCSRWWSCSSYYGATCCGFLHGSCFALPKELH